MSNTSDRKGDSDASVNVNTSSTVDCPGKAEKQLDKRCELIDKNCTDHVGDGNSTKFTKAYCSGDDDHSKRTSGKEAAVISMLNTSYQLDFSGTGDYSEYSQKFPYNRAVNEVAVSTGASSDAQIGTFLKFTTNRDALVEQDVCLFCFDTGHTHKECLKLTLRCYVCGDWGHPGYSCSRRACLICFKFGHFTSKCPIPRKNVDSRLCSRCNCRGHLEKDCPDEWRQYHSFIDSSHLYITKDNCTEARTFNLSCFNCGRTGHLGHECTDAKMYDDRVWQFKPYVTAYNCHLNAHATNGSVEPPPRRWRGGRWSSTETRRGNRRQKPKRTYRKANCD